MEYGPNSWENQIVVRGEWCVCGVFHNSDGGVLDTLLYPQISMHKYHATLQVPRGMGHQGSLAKGGERSRWACSAPHLTPERHQ